MTASAQLCTMALRHRREGMPIGLAWQAATRTRSWAPAVRRTALLAFTALMRREEMG